MALRSPTQVHSYWGPYATGGLPAGADVEVGDTAFDTTLGQLVVCTAVGPVVWTAVGGGGGVSGVTASAPLASSGGATPDISLTAGSAINDVLTWDGAQWVSSAPPLTRQMLSLNGAATGGTVAYIGGVYLPTGITLTAASQAYIGGSAIGDSTTLSLVAIGGGPALATWTISGTLGVATVAGPPVVIPAGWYDLTLQGTAGSGAAFARGLYLA